MKLPLLISLDRTPEQLEETWRMNIREDRRLGPRTLSVSILLFTHEASGASGVMYQAQYSMHRETFDKALSLMGWKLERQFDAPTHHAGKLRAVT